MEGAPALAIEIVSASNRADQMAREVKKYLAGGGIEVWVAYPKSSAFGFSARDMRKNSAASYVPISFQA